MHSLPIFIRLRGRPVILLGEGDVADAKRRLLERAGALPVGEEAQAAFAIVALSGAQAELAAERLKARGVIVNVVDRPDMCDFTMPAIVDRDPVLVAVATGGASAALAKMVRQRIERLLPPSLGRLATALQDARGAIRRRWPDAADRRRRLDEALRPGGMLDPLVDDGSGVEAWLAAGAGSGETGLAMIRLRSPDPDDLTLRTARLLGEADVIYHAPDVPAEILNMARADARRVCVDTPPASAGAGLSLHIAFHDE